MNDDFPKQRLKIRKTIVELVIQSDLFIPKRWRSHSPWKDDLRPPKRVTGKNLAPGTWLKMVYNLLINGDIFGVITRVLTFYQHFQRDIQVVVVVVVFFFSNSGNFLHSLHLRQCLQAFQDGLGTSASGAVMAVGRVQFVMDT